MSIQYHICRHWFRFTLLANFDFYLCLRINFHTSSFWVLILAARGPYWVLISHKNGSLLGPYIKARGVFISFRGSAFGRLSGGWVELIKFEAVYEYWCNWKIENHKIPHLHPDFRMYMPLNRHRLMMYAFSVKFNVCSKRLLLPWIKIWRNSTSHSDFHSEKHELTQIFTQRNTS